MSTRNLQRLFAPRSIAVIGASDRRGSVGHLLLRNLIGTDYAGTVYPVNASSASVQGLHAYASIAEVPREIDLAVIAVPAKSVPGVLRECGEAGVAAALIVSAGFRETGDAGLRLEEEIREIGARFGMRLLGPNCLGYIRPGHHLNVTFAEVLPPQGHIAFLSQSGALGTAILDWARSHEVGFSAFVSVGSMVDVDFGDLIEYFGADPMTTSIILYVESITSARRFMSAARHFAKSKPIVAVKSGRTARGARAASSHTGAIAGDDALYSAVFRRAGVVRVDEIEDLFDASEALMLPSRPRGPRLAIVTNAGGPGVIACDRLISLEGELADLSPATDAKLRALLPEFSSRANPVDVLGDADAARYAAATEALMEDPACDGVLAIFAPQATSDDAATARALVEVARTHPCKPLLASFMGASTVAAGRKILSGARVPSFDTPEHAVRAYLYMWEYARNLASLYETPADILPDFDPDRRTVKSLFAAATREGRLILSEPEAKAVLSAYHIPVNQTLVATTPEECAEAAERIGCPVAVKILSHDITYKSDVGGVALDVRSPEEAASRFVTIVERARRAAPAATIIGATVQSMSFGGHETIIGAAQDPTFGPALMFGLGGTAVELHRDVTFDFPPLSEALARAMVRRTRVSRILEGYRDAAAVDVTALEQALVKVSYLLVDFPEIVEMDVNPLQVRADGVCALNARIVLDPAKVGRTAVPGSHLMIPVYPTRWEQRVTIGGQQILIRAIRPEDEPLWAEMVGSLSPTTAARRFFGPLGAVSKSTLVRYCHIDYDREIALVALREDEGAPLMLGAVSLTSETGDAEAGEFAIVVRDAYQHKGIGRALMKALLGIARERHMREIDGYVLATNPGMLRFAVSLGFTILPSDDPKLRRVVLRL